MAFSLFLLLYRFQWDIQSQSTAQKLSPLIRACKVVWAWTMIRSWNERTIHKIEIGSVKYGLENFPQGQIILMVVRQVAFPNTYLILYAFSHGFVCLCVCVCVCVCVCIRMCATWMINFPIQILTSWHPRQQKWTEQENHFGKTFFSPTPFKSFILLLY